jgi:hypothetical protein
VFIKNDKVLKIGPYQELYRDPLVISHIKSMKLDIPIPNIITHLKVKNELFILMDKIDGVLLATITDKLSKEQKEFIDIQIDKII